MASTSDGRIATIPNRVKFVLGGSAGMAATMFVHPLDLLKNRMQMSGIGGRGREYRSIIHAVQSIVRAEGVFALYNGLTAGLLRQATYTTTRLGIYTWLFEYFSLSREKLSYARKAAIGSMAGCVAAFVGTPADVSLVRMTSDGRLPPGERRGYKNVFDALFRMTKEEGVLSLWRGCGPTIMRAMVVNAAQLATYSQSKQLLLNNGYCHDNIVCHFCASMISAVVTTTSALPVDMAKTRIQNMQIIDGKPEYQSAFNVWVMVIRKEGVLSLWKGYTPYYMRAAPTIVLTFIFLEQLNKAYFKNVLGIEKGRVGL